MIKTRKKILILGTIIISFTIISIIYAKNNNLLDKLAGHILLQVENKGEAWYINPKTKSIYYLGKPSDAFELMRLHGIGISNNDIEKIPIGFTNQTLLDANFKKNYNTNENNTLKTDINFSNKQKGKIFLQVESHGEAWYVNPKDNKRYFLSRPHDAFNIMRELGLGISNDNFDEINRINTQKKQAINFLFFGDMMLDRNVGKKIKSKDVSYLFEKLDKQKFFDGYNIIGANLEGAITNNGDHYKPIFPNDFAFSPSIIKEIKKYNFNFFSIANNHLSDQGQIGVNETKKNLDNLNINYSGCVDTKIGECSSTIIEINYKKIGMIGLSMVYSNFDLNSANKIVNILSKETDLVIVNMHWGQEYNHYFRTKEQNIAHSLINYGADIIIGHHPHVVQGIEIYKNKPIFYSLGNFIFDQYFSDATQEGLAISIELLNDNYFFKLYPFKAISSQPYLINEKDKKIFFNKLIKWSKLSNTYINQIKNGTLSIVNN